jgi:hypothetical protein
MVKNGWASSSSQSSKYLQSMLLPLVRLVGASFAKYQQHNRDMLAENSGQTTNRITKPVHTYQAVPHTYHLHINSSHRSSPFTSLLPPACKQSHRPVASFLLANAFKLVATNKKWPVQQAPAPARTIFNYYIVE